MYSGDGICDADAYLEHLKEELKTVEAESSKISNEIETLTRTQVEGEIFLLTKVVSLKALCLYSLHMQYGFFFLVGCRF